MHISYEDASALDRQVDALLEGDALKPGSRYLFDKLLHNEIFVEAGTAGGGCRQNPALSGAPGEKKIGGSPPLYFLTWHRSVYFRLPLKGHKKEGFMNQSAFCDRVGRVVSKSFGFVSAWACVFVVFMGPAARAEPPEGGTVSIESATYNTMTAVLQGEKGEPFTLEANLQFPDIEKERYPAVVLLHTIGSYRESNEGWYAEQYRKAGFATLTYESIKTRGMHDAHTRGAGPLWGSLAADAYNALKFLAAHPRIDPKRIAVTGYSMGGEVTRLISFEVVRKAFIEGDLKYAAHVAVYPCHTWAVAAGAQSFTGAPVLEQLAGKDDCGPIAKTEMHVAYHKANGHPAPVSFVIYPEAHHNWSDSTAGSPRFYASLASPSKCPLVMVRGISYAFLRGGVEEPWERSQWNECTKESRGYTRGFDSEVRNQSFTDALAFMRSAMGGI